MSISCRGCSLSHLLLALMCWMTFSARKVDNIDTRVTDLELKISRIEQLLNISIIDSVKTTSGDALSIAKPSEVSRKLTKQLAIVFVYAVVPAVCKWGLPEYIKISLQQAMDANPDCDIILSSNYADCEVIKKIGEELPDLIMIDTAVIASKRTLEFQNKSVNILQTDSFGELWITSALRFFGMEDTMKHFSLSEIMHMEADNLMYGRLTSILPQLRKHYPGLAATPLTANKSFITASAFWIASLKALEKFNDYLLELARQGSEWAEYLGWLRKYACCKKNGVAADANGNGIKPHAINEMSMLAFYHVKYPLEFKLFPVTPIHTYNVNRPFCNMSEFSPLGQEVGGATGVGIWDPNSWGQFIGGTHRRKGNDKGFVDTSHVIGQAIRSSSCLSSMLCVPRAYSYMGHHITEEHNSCVLAPFARCNENETWTPLWNLHVHSKKTELYTYYKTRDGKYSNTSQSCSPCMPSSQLQHVAEGYVRPHIPPMVTDSMSINDTFTGTSSDAAIATTNTSIIAGNTSSLLSKFTGFINVSSSSLSPKSGSTWRDFVSLN